MANPAKRKGTDGENGVVEALRRGGWVHAERRALAGVNDKGDVAGVIGWVIEVKACNTLSLSSWMDEVRVEVKNAGAKHGVVWAKRRGKGHAEDWYVIMDGHTFMSLLREAGY